MIEWNYEIKIEISGTGIEAKTKKEAIQKIKDSFEEEYGFTLTDEEITHLEGIKKWLNQKYAKIVRKISIMIANHVLLLQKQWKN